MSVVLVVDDDSDLRETMCDVLEAAGHVTRSARNGEEALRTLRAEPRVDVIVLDLMMPVMSGWEFCRHQSEDRTIAAIPVVVMTAAADLSKAPSSAVQVLPKPVTMKALLAAIAKHGTMERRDGAALP